MEYKGFEGCTNDGKLVGKNIFNLFKRWSDFSWIFGEIGGK